MIDHTGDQKINKFICNYSYAKCKQSNILGGGSGMTGWTTLEGVTIIINAVESAFAKAKPRWLLDFRSQNSIRTKMQLQKSHLLL